MIRVTILLALLHIFAATTSKVVGAKVLSSSFGIAGRKLQNEDISDSGADKQNSLPAGRRKQQEDSDNKGAAPDDFDFGYTYEYEDLADYEPWPIGTQTLLEFADGWFEGEITSFSMSDDKKNATYIVTWSDGTSDSFVNELEWMDLMVANAEDYEPWEIGTPLYGYPNPRYSNTANGEEAEDAFLGGEITAYEKGAYTVKWSNGDYVAYSDFDMVDHLVNNAGMEDSAWLDTYNAWPKGTPVAWDFDDGWWDGTITDFSEGTYEVTWSDKTTKYYSNLEKIDQMVTFANGGGYIGNLSDPGSQNDDQDQPDDIGDDENMYSDYYGLETPVYAQFKDGWWAGYIDSYEGDYYVVRWSDDSVDKFLPGPDMDEIVLNGQYIPNDYGIWPVGTHVYKEFDGNWFWGTIEKSKGGFYTILWDDGERTSYASGKEIDEMVDNAYSAGMSSMSKFIIAILVLGSVGAIAFFVIRRNKTRQELSGLTEQAIENDLDLAEGSENEYSDQPPAEGEQAHPELV